MYEWTFVVVDGGQLFKKGILVVDAWGYVISDWLVLSLERFQFERRILNHDLKCECWNLE